MKTETTCKFCKKGIEVEIDDEYADLGDPFNLLPMASCNRCADLRMRRMRLLDMIRALAMTLLGERNEAALDELKGEMRETAQKLVRKFRELAEDWHHGDCGPWDETMVDALLNGPKYYGNVLGRIWRLSRQPKSML